MTQEKPKTALYFQTTNEWVDRVMRYLSGDELKCVEVIRRKTDGFFKKSDRIAHIKFMEFTGIRGKKTITKCLHELKKHGVIIRVSKSIENKGDEWSVQKNIDLIDLKGLQARDAKRQGRYDKKTEKARANQKVGMCDIPTHKPAKVGMSHIHQGGDVAHPTQEDDSLEDKYPPTPQRGNGKVFFKTWKETPQEFHPYFEACTNKPIALPEPKGKEIIAWLKTFMAWIEKGFTVKQVIDAAKEIRKISSRSIARPGSITWKLNDLHSRAHGREYRPDENPPSVIAQLRNQQRRT